MEEGSSWLHTLAITFFLEKGTTDWRRDPSGSSHWLHGGGNPTDHIITSFTAKHTISEFVRVLKESKHLVKLEVAEDSVNGDVSLKPSVNGDSIDPSECKKESNTDEIKPDRSENNADGTNQDPKEDIVDKIQRLTGIVFRDPDAARKRWHSESLEDENYMKDEPSLHLISDCHDFVLAVFLLYLDHSFLICLLLRSYGLLVLVIIFFSLPSSRFVIDDWRLVHA